MTQFDAIVVGSGPNGLAAAITLAKAGLSVALYEAKSQLGGGVRSDQLTLPGFVHDVCSAIYPLCKPSPFFNSLNLKDIHWIKPEASLAHPFVDGTAALLKSSIEETSNAFSLDSKAYQELFAPIVKNWPSILEDILGPLHFPKNPIAMAGFARLALRSATSLAEKFFKEEKAKSFFLGIAAHSIQPLNKTMTAAFGLILGTLGHTTGWLIPKGGAWTITESLSAYFVSLNGKIFTDSLISSIDELPSSKLILFDVTPKQLIEIAGHRLPGHYISQLKKYRYGPGVFKIDWALSQPIPWKAKECLQAGTVHIAGSVEELVNAEKEVWENKHPEKPYILLAQPSLFDASRSPPGKHTAWAYCHVPNDSNFDMTNRIETQVERFAPGFKDCILAKATKNTLQLENYNPNYIGGDIVGGVQDIFQLYTRPIFSICPYATPLKGVYLCSSSTPPGGGVHGMCGYHAAKIALKNLDKK